MLPSVHAAPADFTFGCEAFAKAFCNGAGFAEGIGNQLLVPSRILRPVGWTRRRIDTHHAVFANAEVAQLFADGASLAHLREKLLAIIYGTHGRAAACGRPHGRDKRSGDKIHAG